MSNFGFTPLSDLPPNWDRSISPVTFIGTRTDISSTDAIDPMFQVSYNTPITSIEVAPAVYGYFTNIGTSVNGSGHGIGCLGRSQDTTGGQVDMIGVEGRIDSFGTAGTHQSYLGISNWSGANFTGRFLYGCVQRVEIRDAPDIGTPVTNGVAISYFAAAIVGGDPSNKWSFYGFDPIRTRGAIRSFNADDSHQILLTASGTDTYLQSSSKIWLTPLSSEYLIMNTCLGFVPITTGAKLGDGSVNLNWEVNATSLKVLNTQVVSTQKTGWTAATGTATRTSFATGSVTLPNLAQAVKALIDDLISHGLIGT